jgi:hypothetical protein
MVKWLMRRGIAAFERQWNYDASYLHAIVEATRARPGCSRGRRQSVEYRKDLPAAAWAAAAITAVRHEDCGPCTQLGVSMAERAGVDAEVLRAVLTDDPDAMPTTSRWRGGSRARRSTTTRRRIAIATRSSDDGARGP